MQLALHPIIETDKEVTTYQYDSSVAYRLIAEAYFKKGEKAKAIENVDKAAAIIRRLTELNSLKESDKDLIAEIEKEKAEYSK